MNGSGSRTGMLALGLGAALIGGGLAMSSALGGSDDGVDLFDRRRQRTTTDITVAGTVLERAANVPVPPGGSGDPRSEPAGRVDDDEDDRVGCDGLDPRCAEISIDDPSTSDREAGIDTDRTTGTTLSGAGEGSTTTGAPPTTDDDGDPPGGRVTGDAADEDDDATSATTGSTTTTTRPPRTAATTTTTQPTTTTRPPATTTTEPPPPGETTTTEGATTTTTEPPPEMTTTTTTLVPPLTIPDLLP